jgi:hypothetical protein
MRALCYFVLGFVALTSQKAQASGPQFSPINSGEVTGIVVGIVAVGVGVGLGVTFLVLHNRGIVEGCVAEANGKKTLVDSSKTAYSLLETGGPSLPVGDRAKVKGHKSGDKSAPTLQVEKVLKVYGPCSP